MNIEQQKLLLQQYNFKRFIFETYPNFIYAKFLQVIIETLQKAMFQARLGKMPRINFCVPPRHGKTSVTSQRFLPWVLLNNPEWEVCVTSYSQTIAEKASLAARNLLENNQYVRKTWPNITISKERSSVKEWFIYDKGKLAGCYRAVGVGGSFTGNGFNCFIEDTKVLCYEGEKKIQDITPMDLVLSFNHETNSYEWKTVVSIMKQKIYAETVTIKTRKRTITCTTNHRIFSGNSYKSATAINIGESCITYDGFHEVLLLSKSVSNTTLRSKKENKEKPSDNVFVMSHNTEQVTRESFSSVTRNNKQEQFVYDLEVEDNHNFFAEGILVHNCMVADDLFKNAEEADSELIRNKVWDWYTSVALTRQAPLNGIVNINTRWHIDDHIGRLLKLESDRWNTLKFPAINAEGKPLFPERFTLHQLLKLQHTMSPRLWSALYEQNPINATGNIIKEQHIKSFSDIPAEFDMMLQSWDLRFSRSQAASSSYVVGQVWGKLQNKYYLTDQVRERLSFVESKSAIQAITAKWPKATLKLVEKKANGDAIEDDLSWLGINLVEPRGDKIQRLERCYGLLVSNQVLIHESLIETIKPEMLAFPNGTHDDQIDAMSQALTWFQDNQFKDILVF